MDAVAPPAGTHSGRAVVLAFVAVMTVLAAYFALGMPGTPGMDRIDRHRPEAKPPVHHNTVR